MSTKCYKEYKKRNTAPGTQSTQNKMSVFGCVINPQRAVICSGLWMHWEAHKGFMVLQNCLTWFIFRDKSICMEFIVFMKQTGPMSAVAVFQSELDIWQGSF
jgi:hypothetical protein